MVKNQARQTKQCTTTSITVTYGAEGSLILAGVSVSDASVRASAASKEVGDHWQAARANKGRQGYGEAASGDDDDGDDDENDEDDDDDDDDEEEEYSENGDREAKVSGECKLMSQRWSFFANEVYAYSG